MAIASSGAEPVGDCGVGAAAGKKDVRRFKLRVASRRSSSRLPTTGTPAIQGLFQSHLQWANSLAKVKFHAALMPLVQVVLIT